MSNTTAETQQFIPLANAYINKNPKLFFVDGAVGGMTASIISSVKNTNYTTYWNTVNSRLTSAGLTPGQVQVIWYKEANAANSVPVMSYYDSLVVQTKRVMNILRQKFPNARLCYMSLRISGRYASSALNPEPYAYYTGWAVKKVIGDQINGDPKLSFAEPGALSPWLCWGIYMWSDGDNPQISNPQIYLTCPSDFQSDGTHPSASGAKKVAQWLLNFYLNDTLSCPWFFKESPSNCSFFSGMVQKTVPDYTVKIVPDLTGTVLKVMSGLKNYSIMLYDLSGQMVYQGQNVKEIETANFPDGIYFYYLRTSKGASENGKVMIFSKK
jgi:hypothetical protein